MVILTYNIGCRNCFQGNSESQTVIDANPEDYINKTEFEVMKIIENWKFEDNNTCQFCGSNSIEILNIKINQTPLFDFESLNERCENTGERITIFEIDKKGSDINLNIGGHQSFSEIFMMTAIKRIIRTLNERPKNNFISQLKGSFQICLIGGYNSVNDTVGISVERFYSHGLTRAEILNQIKPLANQLGIDINIPSTTTEKKANILEGKKFKGAQFNSWFYAESREKAKKEGYSYSNACFNIDEETVIAHGTAFDESPRDFIDKNQFNEFEVDLEKGPFQINGNTVYYAKKC